MINPTIWFEQLFQFSKSLNKMYEKYMISDCAYDKVSEV